MMEILSTGIGSLPHINIDSALAYSFRFDIPFLPQIPVYNDNEYMLYQSLHSLPGMKKPENGIPHLDLKEWLRHRQSFRDKAKRALSTNDFSEFYPSKDVWSCLTAFLFELEQRKIHTAKIQLCGPMTCINSLKLTDHSPITQFPDIIDDIFLCIELSAKSLFSQFKNKNIDTVLFFDEPGLIIYSEQNEFQKNNYERFLKIGKKLKDSNNIELGVHCCADTDWNNLLSSESPWNHISFDFELSGHTLHKIDEETWNTFYSENRSLSPGIVPTGHNAELNHKELSHSLNKMLPLRSKKMLLTPACGLAHRKITDTEEVLSCLNQEKSLLKSLIQ